MLECGGICFVFRFAVSANVENEVNDRVAARKNDESFILVPLFLYWGLD